MNNIAVFIDFENFGHHEAFDAKLLIDKLKERGRLIVKKAYADWGRFPKAKRPMLENSVELIELPSHSHSKNSADIKLVVDALEMAITKDYIDTFVVVSGDSDFTPLISKLREYNKYVIVVGAKKQVSKLLTGYCDELIYYSNLVGKGEIEQGDIDVAYKLLARTINNLEDRGLEVRSSQIKSHMKQLDSSFNEANYGFPQFKRFLEKAQRDGMVSVTPLEHGDYLVKWGTTRGKDTIINIESPRVQGVTSLVCWALKLNLFDNRSHSTISELSSTIRIYLDHSFELTKYGYSKAKGFKSVVEAVAKKGFIKIKYDALENQYFVYPEPKFDEYINSTSPPQNFNLLLHEYMSNKLGMTLNFNLLKSFANEAAAILADCHEKQEFYNMAQLVDICRQNLVERSENFATSKKVINTLLQSQVIKDKDGIPIIDSEDSRKVHTIEPIEMIHLQSLEMVRNALKINFPQEIDIELLSNDQIFTWDVNRYSSKQPSLPVQPLVETSPNYKNFLAHIRKSNMQFLQYPLHYKVLQAIHDVFRNTSRPLTRQEMISELITGSLYIPTEAGELSKTKISGVFQVVHQAGCFDLTYSSEEGPMLLALSPTIKDYAALEHIHDVQLMKLALQADLQMTTKEWAKLLRNDEKFIPVAEKMLEEAKLPGQSGELP